MTPRLTPRRASTHAHVNAAAANAAHANAATANAAPRQVECVQDARGEWTCEGGLEGEDRATTKTVLMTSADDGE